MVPLQETFDTVVNGLRKQGCKSVDENGSCKFRGKDGTKCAIGWLIPDELYSPEMDNYKSSVCAWAVIEELKHDNPLCSKLQTIHDRYPVSQWEKHWEETARIFGLKYTPAGT